MGMFYKGFGGLEKPPNGLCAAEITGIVDRADPTGLQPILSLGR
ncbi:hypothetical protein [Rhizobium halophytocola]|uniref:Uncharacterized protein n=1 Tax=Rhizobium halophytocola TaxID=735519 RepID=A0ABS4DVE3_9HYPH|nr:hypothetical protein [Rhizobium halophytocola]MBP1849656.1 hypothetical protein [Rhizobium halophytocola]